MAFRDWAFQRSFRLRGHGNRTSPRRLVLLHEARKVQPGRGFMMRSRPPVLAECGRSLAQMRPVTGVRNG
jgi:hypothetical protein